MIWRLVYLHANKFKLLFGKLRKLKVLLPIQSTNSPSKVMHEFQRIDSTAYCRMCILAFFINTETLKLKPSFSQSPKILTVEKFRLKPFQAFQEKWLSKGYDVHLSRTFQ